MKDVQGRVAAVTGGGSGLGRSMALAFAGAGMDVALGDVDEAAAEKVAGEIRALGRKALVQKLDVTDRGAVDAFAERVFAELGGAHVVCNNAGVAVFKPVWEKTSADWDWVLGVDLLGIVYGVQAFVPRMVKQGQGGHVVNTSSILGVVRSGGQASYSTAKNGVVGLTETLAIELAPHEIGASVLCPGLIKTGIANSGRNRPARFGGPEPGNPMVEASMEKVGHDAAEVGALVLRAVRENQLYIFTHAEYIPQIEERFQAMLDAHTWAGLTRP